jgi:hypothetical protein
VRNIERDEKERDEKERDEKMKQQGAARCSGRDRPVFQRDMKRRAA